MSDIIRIAGLEIGGGKPIAVQTMCNTHTADIGKSIMQIRQMHNAGAGIIRLTTQGIREVEALKEIKKAIRAEGIDTPLVADIHFNSEVAMAAAKVADKVRINPGNFAKDFGTASSQFIRLMHICKEEGTAVRIGLNHGSLGERIVEKYGDTPEGMAAAAMEWIEMAVSENFKDIAVSLKSSNTVVMANAYRLLHKAMEEKGFGFPLHVGVTEAGNADPGRIKSAVGIGAVLKDGIGDTIRVSLTEDPVNEISAGKIIAGYYDGIRNGSIIPHDPSKPRHYKCNSWEELIILAACEFGTALMDRKIDNFEFSGEYMEEGKTVVLSEEKKEYLKDEIMQAARRRFTKPEYVACPGCGRTMYNLEKTFNEVKKRTAHLKGMTIAVMGCIVNGPGEMADAHYGYIGEGKGKVSIYKGKQAVAKGVPEDKAIDMLVEIIEKDNKSSNQ